MLNGFKMAAMARIVLVSMLGMVHAHMFVIDNMEWFGRPTILQRHSYFQTSAENSANTHEFVFYFSPLIFDEMTQTLRVPRAHIYIMRTGRGKLLFDRNE